VIASCVFIAPRIPQSSTNDYLCFLTSPNGFHGLSYEYIMAALRAEDAAAARGRVIIAHLGNGAGMAAVRDGIGVETTMGFSPTGGLAMGTRAGDLDPGVLL